MKIKQKMFLLYVSLIIIVFISTAQSLAKIDIETCVGIWTFDKGDGENAEDYSQYGNNGQLIGKPKWIEGKFEQAISLNGVDQWVQVPDSESLRVTDAVTVMAWIKPQRYTFPGHDWQGILAKANNPRSYSLYTHTSERFLLAIHSAGQHCVGWSNGNGSPLLKEWSHVAASGQEGEMKLFMNGSLTKETPLGTLKALPGDSDTEDVVIGRTWENARFFEGEIDEVAIFNVALSEDDIKDIATKGVLRALGIKAVFPSGKLADSWANIKKLEFNMK